MHSHSNWWLQPSWILPSWIQTLPSWIQTPCYLLSDSLKNTLTVLWLWLKLVQSDSNSFILTQLDDGSHLEFCHLGYSHVAQNSDSILFNLTQSHSLWLTGWWQPSWTLPYWILPSWIQPFCKKTLTQTSSIWLKLIHSHLTWWWQPSWIWKSWIQPS